MNFTNAAGFAMPRVAALASSGNTAPRLQHGAIRPLDATQSGIAQEAALQCIATTVRESASSRRQMDFERVDRRTEALTQLRGTIVDLKSRIERKSGGRSRLVMADAGLQLSYKAS